MTQASPIPHGWRWPLILGGALVIGAAVWSGIWYAAAAVAERTIAGWQDREARAGRVYSCAAQDLGGFPFGIRVRCTGFGAELSSTRPPFVAKARDLLISAHVWQPTVLTTEIVGPLSIAELGQDVGVAARWSRARTEVRGLPASPEKVSITFEAPTVERVPGGESLFKASRVALEGRMVSGTAQNHPVVEVTLMLTGAAAPNWHPATVLPVDAEVTAVLRGLKDFSPKPWPERLRELQAAGGRIEITRARVRQGSARAVANGVLGLSPGGRLDGELSLTVANVERLLQQLGLDRMLAQKAPTQLGNAFNALDRILPGLGQAARQNAGPMIAASLNLIGRPTELEGQRAVLLPLRFRDGAVLLGPLAIGNTPPLF
jgi:hypothetical protein